MLLLANLTIFATPFQYNGIYYELISDTSMPGSTPSYGQPQDVRVTTPTSNGGIDSDPSMSGGSSQVFGHYSGDIVIPASFVTGNITYNVVEIGNYAFKDCINLTSVTLPNTITKIGIRAFHFAYNLSSITIPNSVQTIEWEAFRDCKSLTGIVIPDNVQTIASKTFYNCEKLSDVTIGNSVASIADDAFANCPKITNITWNAVDCESRIIFSAPRMVKSFTFGPAVTFIPDSCCQNLVNLATVRLNCTMLGYIGEKLFQNTAITSIVIPNSVSNIKKYAFAGCVNLTQVTLPSSIIKISEGVFSGSGIASAIIPERITSVEPYAYANCPNLQIVEIPKNLTTINHVFDGCNNIKQVRWNAIDCRDANFGNSVEKFTFGESVKVIPWNLCQNMTKLTSIVIPNSVEQIYTSAFDGCSSVTSLQIGSNVRKIGNYAFQGTKISNLVIPDMVDTIGSYAFANSSLLSSVVVGKNVKFIDGFAFGNCTNLKTIFNYSNLNFAPTSPSQGAIAQYATEIYNQMEKIGDFLFAHTTSYKLVAYTGNDSEITLPASFRGQEYTIAKGVFTNNQNLTSVTIPNGLTYLSDSVFAGCSNLATVSIPSSMDQIGKYAFAGCVALTEVNLGGTTLLNQNAFNGCTNLSEIIFGSTIQTIGLNAFSGCNNISAITCMASTPPVLANATVSHISPSIPVNVPAGSAPAYQAATGWQHFTNYISKGLVAATGISISEETLNMAIGDEHVLSASVLPANATFKSYTWSVSNPQVADIQSGIVYAKRAGTSVITCTSTDGGYTASCTVTVAANTVLATGLGIRYNVWDHSTCIQSNVDYNDGDTLSLMELYDSYVNVTVLPGYATNTYVDYVSSDPSVVSVKLTGHYTTGCHFSLTPHRAGVATITLNTTDGTNFTRNIIVKVTPDPTVYVTGVVVTPRTLDIATGKTDTIFATILPTNATNQRLSWFASKWGMVSVNNGVVTAKTTPGTVVVTCRTSDGSFEDSCIVNVIVPVQGVTLNKTNVNLSLNGYPTTATLRATFTPANVSNKNVIWTSEDENIATVSESGLVTATGPGTTTVTCITEDGGYTASCTVTVTGTTISVTGVSLSQSSLSLNVGESSQLTATITPANATNKNVTWSSSNSNVASVNSNGLVSAIASGHAVVTCKTVDGNYQATCSITVAEQSSIDVIDHLYMIGNLASGEWNTTSSIEMEKIGTNVFKVTETLTQPTSYFAFTSVQSSNWDVVNSNRWGGNNNDLVSPTIPGILVEGENCFTAAAGTYEFVVNLNTNVLTLTSVNPGTGDEAYAAEPTNKTTINQVMTDILFYDGVESDGLLDIVMMNNTHEINLFLFTNRLDPNCVITPGTYPINSTGNLNTVWASEGGDEQGDYPSILVTDFESIGGNTYYNTVYYLVSGTFKVEFVQGVFTATLNAKSYNGSTIKAVYTSIVDAIESNIVDTNPIKVVRDGQVLIQRGDRLYDLRGIIVEF